MTPLKAMLSGVIGAGALTLIHETARQALPQAPRLDLLGMRAIAQSMLHLNQSPPANEALHRTALIGDLIFNSLYYSLVGLGRSKGAVGRGVVLGLAAGIGAVTLPGPLGLGEAPSTRTKATAVMTILWYLAGGLAAASVYRLLGKRPKK